MVRFAQGSAGRDCQRAMCIRLVEADKGIIVTFFESVGGNELRVIENSGFWFGGLFGIGQMFVFMVYNPKWLLPIAGFIVGWFTNFLALKLVFEPVRPVRFPGGFELQGVFLKRQKEVSVEFAALSFEHFCNAQQMWSEILHGAKRADFEALVAEYTAEFFDNTLGDAKPLASFIIGHEALARLKSKMAQHLVASMPTVLPASYEYQNEVLGVADEVASKMMALPPEQFERVLHPVFEQDEIKLIVVGGVLGALVGVFQALVLF